MKLLIMILEIMGEMFDDIEISDDFYRISLETEPLMSKLFENLNIDQAQTDDVSSQSSLNETFHLSEELL